MVTVIFRSYYNLIYILAYLDYTNTKANLFLNPAETNYYSKYMLKKIREQKNVNSLTVMEKTSDPKNFFTGNKKEIDKNKYNEILDGYLGKVDKHDEIFVYGGLFLTKYLVDNFKKITVYEDGNSNIDSLIKNYKTNINISGKNKYFEFIYKCIRMGELKGMFYTSSLHIYRYILVKKTKMSESELNASTVEEFHAIEYLRSNEMLTKSLKSIFSLDDMVEKNDENNFNNATLILTGNYYYLNKGVPAYYAYLFIKYYIKERGTNYIIKPHPRIWHEYKIFKSPNVKVLDKNAPIELIMLNKLIEINKVISDFSSSVGTFNESEVEIINHNEEKLILKEYIKKIKNDLKNEQIKLSYFILGNKNIKQSFIKKLTKCSEKYIKVKINLICDKCNEQLLELKSKLSNIEDVNFISANNETEIVNIYEDIVKPAVNEFDYFVILDGRFNKNLTEIFACYFYYSMFYSLDVNYLQRSFNETVTQNDLSKDILSNTFLHNSYIINSENQERQNMLSKEEHNLRVDKEFHKKYIKYVLKKKLSKIK